ncbi:MAG: acyl-CoA dehydrogenase family protein [Bacillota bacterium]|nr:acyl-CoA dehydrogenase family protein [Bacillota bacterium]
MSAETERTDRQVIAAGGGWLLGPVQPEEVRVPEELSPEQQALAEAAGEFVERQVLPHMGALEEHDQELLVELMHQAGEQGLLGLEIPEEYGGLGLDRTGATRVTEAVAPSGGFAVTHGAHVGIGSLPLVFFGSEEQKRRYLPRLASGEWIAAYALTEPGYGSDALHARTTARLSEDGTSYILNGEKQWITNAGIADLFTVFAQLEGAGFTAFLVERGFPGVSTGPEYEKMGLRSSSTRPLILQEARVPVENLLGEPGKGHRVALGILDIGRLNLGAGALGSSKRLVDIAARYALEREQFGRPIAEFGLIREKLAEMEARTWALEAMVYRTSGLIDAELRRSDATDPAKATAEYALECAAVKVYGSEVLDYVVDEAVQIHGGYGYMREYEVERAYRDARINRIFEGTNEINRLTIPDTLLRRALKGRLPLMQVLQALQQELPRLRRPAFFDQPLEEESWRVEALKKASLMVGGLAVERYGQALEEEEELLGSFADMLIETYAAESALLRARKRRASGGADALAEAIARLTVDRAARRVRDLAGRALAALYQGDELRLRLALVDRLAGREPIDEIGLRRQVAQRVLEARGYVA